MIREIFVNLTKLVLVVFVLGSVWTSSANPTYIPASIFGLAFLLLYSLITQANVHKAKEK